MGYPTYVIDGGNLNVTFNEELKRILLFTDGIEFEYYKNIYNGQTITINNVSSDVEFKYKDYVAKLKSGSLTEIGSEVCIGNECFHIINNDGTTLSMVSKYNLYVGGTLDENGSKYTSYGDEATGLQDPKMRGYYAANKVRHGVIQFGPASYWSSTTSTYPSYVFNESSNMYSHALNYKNYLTGLGVVINNIRLLNTNDLSKLGCSISAGKCSNTNYKFIYYTTFWSGDAVDSNRIYRIVSDGRYNALSGTGKSGLRPVIELPVDEVKPLVSVKSGNVDTVGSEVCISDECFYVISSDSDSVALFAKYNLNVGNKVESYNNVVPLENPTGIQDINSVGYKFENGQYYYPFIGTTAVYDDTTNFIDNYMNNYKQYLISKGVNIMNIRYISLDELKTFGFVEDDYCSVGTSSWLYSTSYWAEDYNGVTNDCYMEYVIHDMDDTWGVRPVIEISKDYF